MRNEILNTVEYGKVRILQAEAITRFDEYIGQDIVWEWNFYCLPSGEVVAVEND